MEKKKESLQSNNVLKQNSSLQISSKAIKKLRKKQAANQSGITLIALVVTILFSYDEKLKFNNSKGFLLQTI